MFVVFSFGFDLFLETSPVVTTTATNTNTNKNSNSNCKTNEQGKLGGEAPSPTRSRLAFLLSSLLLLLFVMLLLFSLLLLLVVTCCSSCCRSRRGSGCHLTLSENTSSGVFIWFCFKVQTSIDVCCFGRLGMSCCWSCCSRCCFCVLVAFWMLWSCLGFGTWRRRIRERLLNMAKDGIAILVVGCYLDCWLLWVNDCFVGAGCFVLVVVLCSCCVLYSCCELIAHLALGCTQINERFN